MSLLNSFNALNIGLNDLQIGDDEYTLQFQKIKGDQLNFIVPSLYIEEF